MTRNPDPEMTHFQPGNRVGLDYKRHSRATINEECERPHYRSSWQKQHSTHRSSIRGEENLPQAVRLETPCCVREADNGLCRSPRTEPQLERAQRH